MATYEYEEITVSTTPIGLTNSKLYVGRTFLPSEVVITVEDAPIRFQVGENKVVGDPSSSAGEMLNIEDRLILDAESDIRSFQAIRLIGTDARLTVHFFNGQS